MSVSLIDGHIDREKQTLTDNEIIKALERCSDGTGKGIIKATLDLIKRKDEQIEALIAGQETLQKALNEKIEDVERLEKHTEMYHEVRTEAVKEFAENVTYCKDCENYELMTSNNQRFCNKYGGYVKETDCCSRGTPCKRNGG